jgi:hypothetical protein
MMNLCFDKKSQPFNLGLKINTYTSTRSLKWLNMYMEEFICSLMQTALYYCSIMLKIRFLHPILISEIEDLIIYAVIVLF